jgi:two-component system CheB/CheR fusion protein
MHLPENPGAAFVVVQHPNAEENHSIGAFLSQFTSLTISPATHGTTAQGNCIYLPPENQVLTYRNGHFHLEDAPRSVVYPGDRCISAFAGPE